MGAQALVVVPGRGVQEAALGWGQAGARAVGSVQAGALVRAGLVPGGRGWCRRGRGLDCWSWGCCLCSALGGLLGFALCLVECLLAGLAPALDGGGGWPEVDGRLSVDALGGQSPVVNTLGAARAGQGVIGHLGPALAPECDLDCTVGAVVQLAGLVSKAVGPKAAGGAEDVRVVVAGVALFARFVDGHVHGASVVLDQLHCQRMGQLWRWSASSSSGRATSNSRATVLFFLVSDSSALFHSSARSLAQPGASSGTKSVADTMPFLRR